MPGKNENLVISERMDSISSMPKRQKKIEPLKTSNPSWGESCSSFSTINQHRFEVFRGSWVPARNEFEVFRGSFPVLLCTNLRFLEAAGCLPETNLRFLEAAWCLPEANLRFLEAAGCLPETNLRFLEAAGCLPETNLRFLEAAGCLPETNLRKKTFFWDESRILLCTFSAFSVPHKLARKEPSSSSWMVLRYCAVPWWFPGNSWET